MSAPKLTAEAVERSRQMYLAANAKFLEEAQPFIDGLDSLHKQNLTLLYRTRETYGAYNFALNDLINALKILTKGAGLGTQAFMFDVNYYTGSLAAPEFNSNKTIEVVFPNGWSSHRTRAVWQFGSSGSRQDGHSSKERLENSTIQQFLEQAQIDFARLAETSRGDERQRYVILLASVNGILEPLQKTRVADYASEYVGGTIQLKEQAAESEPISTLMDEVLAAKQAILRRSGKAK